ncbi:MAG: recombinase family protein [Micrococcales bacterium]|nr:recombinase family protein [Micrococcales bacterium]
MATNLRKAEHLGALVVEEFIDAGESAKSADRPELQRMIEYVKTHPVAYCIVHKVDRLARNRADDVTIHLALRDAGVVLVSATENIDETPSGMLLHGIMSTIAEFYSRNLAAEVTKGLTQKAATGGTVARAPLGYLNVRRRDGLGRDVRTVETDPERAELVRWAFAAYATGTYSTITLHAELVDRGLTTVPTPKRPARAPGLSTVQKMLSNPYYKGEFHYKGACYDGLHEPLVSPEVWYRVQNVLAAHQVSGEKTQTHDHYLKGTVYCGTCGSRLIFTNAKNRHGIVYPYFICAGRHSRRTACTRQAMPAAWAASTRGWRLGRSSTTRPRPTWTTASRWLRTCTPSTPASTTPCGASPPGVLRTDLRPRGHHRHRTGHPVRHPPGPWRPRPRPGGRQRDGLRHRRRCRRPYITGRVFERRT